MGFQDTTTKWELVGAFNDRRALPGIFVVSFVVELGYQIHERVIGCQMPTVFTG